MNASTGDDDSNGRPVVIFDGVCKFCNAAVNFIIRRDPTGIFAFAPMQGAVGQKLIEKHSVSTTAADTLLLVRNGTTYQRTDAALEIARDLTGFWHLLRLLKVIPRPVRDALYSFFARHRYALFGRSSTCMVPSGDVRDRFIE